MEPIYYIHSSKYLSPQWVDQSKYRMTADKVIKLLGFYSNFTEQDLLLEMTNGVVKPFNDAVLWDNLHIDNARREYGKFKPNAIKMDVGLCVNAKHPFLACSPHDFVWDGDKIGMIHYKCPFSQRLLKDPLPVQDIVMAYNLGVLEYARPHIDYVCWTPSASTLKEYNYDSVLIEEDKLTLRKLYDEFIFPKVTEFIEKKLKPTLTLNGINTYNLEELDKKEYVPVYDPNLSAKEMIRSFASNSS